VADNQVVHAGDVLLRVDPRDYQARVDQSCAQLEAAESQARGANAGVPLTSATTASGTSAAAAQLAAASADRERAVADYERASSSELAVAKADVDAKRATADRARADLERMAPLAAKNEISKLQFDAFVAGQRVAASELVASEQKLANAGKQAESSKALMTASEARVEAARAMLAQANANRRQVDISAAQAGSASAAILQARAALHAAELELSYTSITAPIDGVITQKLLDVGAMASTAQPIVSIAASGLKITVSAADDQVANLAVGAEAAVTGSTLGTQVVSAKITNISPSGDTRNRTFAVDLTPDSTVTTLRPGMFVQVTLSAVEHKGVIAVPNQAILERAGKSYVFAVNNNVAKLVPVTVAISDGKLTEVTGIDAGTKVVVQGQDQLSDGDRVTVATQ